jgi:hypothetical protein
VWSVAIVERLSSVRRWVTASIRAALSMWRYRLASRRKNTHTINQTAAPTTSSTARVLRESIVSDTRAADKNQDGHSSLITGVTDDGGQLRSYLLIDYQLNPWVGRAVEWDSVQAIEPSLNALSPEVVNDAFDDAGARVRYSTAHEGSYYDRHHTDREPYCPEHRRLNRHRDRT